MHCTLRHVLLASALLALNAGLLPAQDNPLDFVDLEPRIGVEVGLNSVWQEGTYRSGCGIFEEGANLNFMFGVAYDHPIGQLFRFEALAGYQSRGVESSYLSREAIGVSTTSGPVDALIDFDNIGRAQFSYFFLQPSLKFYPFEQLYAGAGFSANFLASAQTQYQKDILSRTIELREFGLAEVSYSPTESSDPYSKVFDPEDRQGEGFTSDIVMMLGAEFVVGRTGDNNPVSFQSRPRVYLGPRVQYTIPMSAALVDQDDRLKLSTLQFLVGLRYRL